MFLINKSIELRILETNKELNSWSCLIESKDSLNLFKQNNIHVLYLGIPNCLETIISYVKEIPGIEEIFHEIDFKNELIGYIIVLNQLYY